MSDNEKYTLYGCGECGLHEVTHACGACGKWYCDSHISGKCSKCKKWFCTNHPVTSFSGMQLCEKCAGAS